MNNRSQLENAFQQFIHEGIAAFFSINNQISAHKARQQLGWKPKTALSLLEDVAQSHK